MSENLAYCLTYYMHDEAAAFRFQLAGDLSRDTTADLDQARETASSVIGGRPLIVDMTGIKSIDTAGCQLLEKWNTLGAQFVGTTRLAKMRIQSMTDVPFCLVGKNPDRSEWLPGRLVAWLLAAVFVFSLLAAVLATWHGSDFLEPERNGLSTSLLEQSR